VLLTARLNVRGGIKTVMCLPKNIEQAGRTSTKPVSDLPLNGLGVSMQRLSATIAVTPKGRIINSCTVDYQTVFMLIMETQVSKLTLGLQVKVEQQVTTSALPATNSMPTIPNLVLLSMQISAMLLWIRRIFVCTSILMNL
jgi:hypothetical protein